MFRLDPDLLSAQCVVKGVRIRTTDETNPGHDFERSVPHQLVVPSRLAKRVHRADQTIDFDNGCNLYCDLVRIVVVHIFCVQQAARPARCTSDLSCFTTDSHDREATDWGGWVST
jgi:hypothetical protein